MKLAAWFLLFSYMFIIARLLGHKDGNFVFVALFFVVVSEYALVFALGLAGVALFATLFSPCMVYGKINSSLFLNALVADSTHVLEFIATLPARLFFSVSFVWLSIVALIRLRHFFLLGKKASRALLLLFFGHLLLFRPVGVYAQNHIKNKNEKFALMDVFYDSKNFLLRDALNIGLAYAEAVAELDKQERILNAGTDWNPQVNRSEFDDYVVVIGESARRDALHGYGFKIENTPFLTAVPKVQFTDYISAGGHTVVSLSNTFVLDYRLGGNPGNNVVDLANRAGFKTYWLSNQFEVGIYDSIVGGIGKRAGYYKFLNVANNRNALLDDFLLLPHIKKALGDKAKGQRIIFVHLYGSHMSFCGRVGDKYEVFHVNKKLSCYVQSIKQTDELLKEIHQMLQQHKEQTGREWTMVYFSDHGLAANKAEETILPGEKCKANYRVPFVVLNSRLTETRHIHARRSALNFFDFFSAWTGIQDDLLPNQCDFFSEASCPDSRTVVHDNQDVNFSSLEKEEVNYFQFESG